MWNHSVFWNLSMMVIATGRKKEYAAKPEELFWTELNLWALQPLEMTVLVGGMRVLGCQLWRIKSWCIYSTSRVFYPMISL